MLERLEKDVRRVFERQVEHERNSAAHRLSKEEAQRLAVFAFTSIILLLMTRLMMLAKYGSITREDLATYHPGASWLAGLGTLLFVYVAWHKGIRYWLVYVTSLIHLFGPIVHLMLHYGALDPEDLHVFNTGPDWWRGL